MQRGRVGGGRKREREGGMGGWEGGEGEALIMKGKPETGMRAIIKRGRESRICASSGRLSHRAGIWVILSISDPQ